MVLTGSIRPILALSGACLLSLAAAAQAPFEEELRRLHAESAIACLCRVRSIQPDPQDSTSLLVSLAPVKLLKGNRVGDTITIRLRPDAVSAALRAGKSYLLFAYAPLSPQGQTSFVHGGAGLIDVGADPRILGPPEALPIRGSPRRLRRAPAASAPQQDLPNLERVLAWLEAFSRHRSGR